MENKRIGIIIPSGNLFNSGMAQNAYFIYDVLMATGHTCDLLCFDEKHTKLGYNNTPVKTIYDNDLRFDVEDYKLIVTVATGLCKAMYATCKANNIRVVAFICGNMFQTNNLSFITENSLATIVTKETPCDLAWIIASFGYMKTYVELIRGVPARTVPHLRSPMLIEYATKNHFHRDPADLVYKPANHTRKKVTLLIMEPNIEPTKTALIPIMAAEKLHLTHPDLIDEVLVFSFPTKSQAASKIINSLSIRPKMRLFSRLHIVDILTTYNKKDTMPIFVSHQQHHEWNYMYYEMMYYGYPFVHNSGLMKDFGYYYDGFNIDRCVTQIQTALEGHNALHAIHMKQGRAYIDTIDPAQNTSRQVWTDLVAEAIALEPEPKAPEPAKPTA